MKKLTIILILMSIVLLKQVNKAEAFGLFYTNASYPVTATGVESPKDLTTLKKGQSSALNVLGVVEIGDAGINKAASEVNIQKVNYIDINEKTVFIFFRRITTTVYGE